MAKDRSIDRETLRLFWSESLKQKRLLLLSGLFPVNTVLMAVIAPLFISKVL